MVKVYRLKGDFGQKGEKQKFTMDVRALKPEEAREKAYTDIGSRHKVKRFLIRIDSIKEISPEDSRSVVIGQLSRGG